MSLQITNEVFLMTLKQYDAIRHDTVLWDTVREVPHDQARCKTMRYILTYNGISRYGVMNCSTVRRYDAILHVSMAEK